jgi:thiamine biosynthesis protein ThiI
MHPPGADTVLVRHGEIGVKSEQVRRKMEARLRDNLGAMLADRGVGDPVETRRTRLFVHTDPDRIEQVTDAATDTFGVVSASPALRVDPTMDAIRDALAAAAREHYAGEPFAVRARRAGEPDAHPFSSGDLEEQGGAAVWEAAAAAGFEPAVDLEDPESTFFIECRADDAYVFLEKRDGPGGLPLGTQRPLVALLSGGIDSPVAAWEIMRRGCPVVPLYVDLGEYGGADHRARAASTVEALSRYAPQADLALRVAPAGSAVERIADATDELRMLVLRRFMFRVAERLAREVGAVGIVTGEAVGQKSSQTSANLAATSAATDLPVHRPLLSMDKSTITERAREIGSFEESTIPAGCNRVAPDFPETAAAPAAVSEAEPDDAEALARRVADRITEPPLEAGRA